MYSRKNWLTRPIGYGWSQIKMLTEDAIIALTFFAVVVLIGAVILWTSTDSNDD